MLEEIAEALALPKAKGELIGKTPAPIGWALTQEHLLQNQSAPLKSLMREVEIRKTKQVLSNGRKVLVYGNEGAGKTTFLTELKGHLSEENTSIHIISSKFGSEGELRRSIESIDDLEQEYQRTGIKPVLMIDSADYLWEQTSEGIMTFRKQFYQRCLDSKIDIIMTFHDSEPKGKKTDFQAKKYFDRLNIEKRDNIDSIQLSPEYSADKVKNFLTTLGFNEEIADYIASHSFARYHASLRNYFLKEYREKDLAVYLNRVVATSSLERARSYITNILKKFERGREMNLSYSQL